MVDQDQLRLFPPQDERVESGPIRFGDDWPGVFIRGDNALHFAHTLDAVLQRTGDIQHEISFIERKVLEGLRDTLRSCEIRRQRG